LKNNSLKLSIVIPTINRYSDLKNTLGCLYRQSFDDFEIIIIDQTEKFEEIIGDKIRYYHTTSKSASKARNIGLKMASNDIVLFLDDDVVIDNKEFLSTHVLHYLDPKTSGVSGAILDTSEKFEYNLHKKAETSTFGWFYFPSNYSKASSVANGGSGNLSVRREWAINVGGMDERFERGAFREETDFCLRYTKVHGHLIYDPTAYLIHLGNPNGGCRSWESYKGIIHGGHHMFGGWYLMFRRLNLQFWPTYSYYMLRRFIIHKKLTIRPYLIPIAIFVFTYAFFRALYFSIKEPLLITRNSHSKNGLY